MFVHTEICEIGAHTEIREIGACTQNTKKFEPANFTNKFAPADVLAHAVAVYQVIPDMRKNKFISQA